MQDFYLQSCVAFKCFSEGQEVNLNVDRSIKKILKNKDTIEFTI